MCGTLGHGLLDGGEDRVNIWVVYDGFLVHELGGHVGTRYYVRSQCSGLYLCIVFTDVDFRRWRTGRGARPIIFIGS